MEYKQLQEEFDAFKMQMGKITIPLCYAIKGQVSEWYSYYESYEDANLYPTKTPQIIESIDISYHLNVYSSVNFVTLDKVEKSGIYSFNVDVTTNKNSYYDGRLTKIVWEFVKGKLDLSLYPNLNKPKFTGDMLVHGGEGKWVRFEDEDWDDVHQMD